MSIALTFHDAVMIGAGGVAVAAALAAAGAGHKVFPAVTAWFASHKAALAALETKVRSGFTFTSKAIASVEDHMKSLNAGLRSDFQTLETRLAEIETAVFGKPKSTDKPASPPAPAAPAPKA